jgi:hypothetical protein
MSGCAWRNARSARRGDFEWIRRTPAPPTPRLIGVDVRANCPSHRRERATELDEDVPFHRRTPSTISVRNRRALAQTDHPTLLRLV